MLVKIDVGVNDIGEEKLQASIAFSALSWDKDGPTAELPLFLRPRVEYKFESEPPIFSMWSILGNPMILMTVIPLGLLLLMPKLMENMDPEALKEFQEAQKVKGNPTQPIEMPDVSQTLANWFVPSTNAPKNDQVLTTPKSIKKRK